VANDPFTPRPTMRAKAIRAPAKGFQILSGGFRRLEMRGVKLGLGHGKTLLL
jgi:hypothetical protein